jgi:hypothetical protein
MCIRLAGHGDASFVIAKQSSEKAGPAHLLLPWTSETHCGRHLRTDRCTTELPARERAGGEQIAGGCHNAPDYQPGAAAITLRRYTHTLSGELERARDGAGSVPRESGPDRRRHEIWLR